MKPRLLVLLAALLAACGGQAESEEPGGQETDQDGGWLDKGPLGKCEDGWARGTDPSAPCPWTYDGKCYAEREVACACACGASMGELCSSGFPGDQVEVSCL